MQCPSCGTQNHDGAKFCLRCGATLTAPTQVNAQAPAQASVQAPLQTQRLNRPDQGFTQQAPGFGQAGQGRTQQRPQGYRGAHAAPAPKSPQLRRAGTAGAAHSGDLPLMGKLSIVLASIAAVMVWLPMISSNAGALANNPLFSSAASYLQNLPSNGSFHSTLSQVSSFGGFMGQIQQMSAPYLSEFGSYGLDLSQVFGPIQSASFMATLGLFLSIVGLALTVAGSALMIRSRGDSPFVLMGGSLVLLMVCILCLIAIGSLNGALNYLVNTMNQIATTMQGAGTMPYMGGGDVFAPFFTLFICLICALASIALAIVPKVVGSRPAGGASPQAYRA